LALDPEPIFSSLTHRGPDDRGSVELEGDERRCTLYHTRLSILDLSAAGHQPMCTADRRYWIAYNGEVYNHAELRAQLERAGVRLRSRCDTEVVLEAYAIFDTATGRLFLARDHLGVKPLYVCRVEGGLAFASEIRTLLAAGVAQQRLSRSGLTHYLSFGSFGARQTALEGVTSLPPASWLTLDGAGERSGVYWRPPEADAEEATSFEARSRELRVELETSVRLQLEADVPTGVFLSGGMDSTGIAALAAASSSHQVRTFTVAFDEKEYDEGAQAKETARRLGCDHHEVRLHANGLVAEVNDVIADLDQPSTDGVNTWFIAKAAHDDGLKVALSGMGADEIFAGYDYFRQFRTILRWRQLLEPLAAGLSWMVPDTLLWRMPTRLRKAMALAGRAHGDPYSVLRALFTEREQRILLSQLAEQSEGPVLPPGFELDSVNSWARLELTHYLANTLLRDGDAMSMAHGLEVRVPYLDHKVVELALRTPGGWKIRPGTNKPLLSSSLREIPVATALKPNLGFTLPLDEWFRGPLRDWLEAYLLGGKETSGPFRPEVLRKLWAAFLRGDGSVSHARVWSITALLAWCERHHIECN
jgi:asparagine synthase (glutamine-hydrolysing)